MEKNEACYAQPSIHINDNIEQSNQGKNIHRISREKLEQRQILIAEPENELLLLFKSCISSSGMTAISASSGDDALNFFIDSEKQGRPLDVIVLDTHLINPSGLDIAKRVRKRKPDQRVVLVTTTPKENLPVECLKTARIDDKDILTIPFKLSKLVEVLKN